MKDKETVSQTAAPSLLDLIARHAPPPGTVPPGTLEFPVSSANLAIIMRIVERVEATIAPIVGGPVMVKFDRLIAAMDIANVHTHGCPLSLWQWLASDPSDFMADFLGIVRHVNRTVGGIDGEWRPRFRMTMQ